MLRKFVRQKVQVFETDQVVCCDVDDTLVMWNLDDKSKDISIPDPYSPGVSNFVTPHLAHIQLLRKFKERGFTIIVWSAGGFKWAHNVVNALEIEPFVDLVMSKPCRYIDDLACKEWMGPRIYIK